MGDGNLGILIWLEAEAANKNISIIYFTVKLLVFRQLSKKKKKLKGININTTILIYYKLYKILTFKIAYMHLTKLTDVVFF